jgi:hypothetical protein
MVFGGCWILRRKVSRREILDTEDGVKETRASDYQDVGIRRSGHQERVPHWHSAHLHAQARTTRTACLANNEYRSVDSHSTALRAGCVHSWLTAISATCATGTSETCAIRYGYPWPKRVQRFTRSSKKLQIFTNTYINSNSFVVIRVYSWLILKKQTQSCARRAFANDTRDCHGPSGLAMTFGTLCLHGRKCETNPIRHTKRRTSLRQRVDSVSSAE